jgi:hypothetical protein
VEERVRDDLQDLVDRVSRLLAAPATLEDAEFTLLAFCAHPLDGGERDGGGAVLDAVRTRSILTRGSSPEVRRWFEEFGIAHAERPLRTPGDPAAGILTRLVLPVRHAGRTRGYLWLLDGGRTDPADLADPALAEAVALAAEAGRVLAERSGEDGDLDRALGDALEGTAGSRQRAQQVLAGALGDGPQVLVALHAAGGLPAGWEAPVATAVARPAAAAPTVAVLVPLGGGTDLRPAAALTAAALPGLPPGSTAGISEVCRGAAGLAAQWEQARTAARVAAAEPALSPVAHWGELGAWRLVSRLPGPDPAVAPLLADAVLARTAETWLDAGGSPARTAAALSIHRQTLYHRLGRIAQLTRLDLADGDARLLLHASLRRARLETAEIRNAARPGS